MAVTTNRTFLILGHIMLIYVVLCACMGLSFGVRNDIDIPGIDIKKSLTEESKSVPLGKATEKPSLDKDKGYHDMRTTKDKIITSHGRKQLHIFCYDGEPKTLTTLFKTVQLNLEVEKDNFFHYEGPNATDIKRQQKEGSWFTFYPWRPRTFKLDLYMFSCIGIETPLDFTIGLRIRWVDFWRVMLMVGAVILFFAASHLAKNIFFHYTTGIALGIFGSLIIIVMYLRKFIPTKSAAFSVMVGGWGLTIYLAQYIWQNFVELLKEYQAIAIGYVIVAGLLSFAVVYRYGPLTDQRSVSLVQWAMQLFSLVAVFFSSQYREASLSLVISMITYQNIPSKWKAKALTIWRRRFPPKIRILTEEEFIQQGNIETRKALEELRQYCRSPNCNAWKTVSRIKTPTRFAEFVEGGSHLDDDAILSYESNHVSLPRDEDDLYLTTDEED